VAVLSTSCELLALLYTASSIALALQELVYSRWCVLMYTRRLVCTRRLVYSTRAYESVPDATTPALAAYTHLVRVGK
jgi:hypothetical protein